MTDRLAPLDALLAASTPDQPAFFVSRPRGVAHVYAGPLTPSGAAPSSRRPVCGARTRRLYAGHALAGRNVCARCSTRLAAMVPAARVESPATATRADDREVFAGLTLVDLYLSVRSAATDDELDTCSYVLQLMFTPAERVAGFTSPSGRTFSNLPAILKRQRRRLHPDFGLPPARSKAARDADYRAVIEAARVPSHRRHTVRLRTA